MLLVNNIIPANNLVHIEGHTQEGWSDSIYKSRIGFGATGNQYMY